MKFIHIVTCVLAAGLSIQVVSPFAKDAEEILESSAYMQKAPKVSVSLKELARIYWPDTNATTARQEETLKGLLGKSVTWEITIAQIQREGKLYLVQGQSDENMLGTFSYIKPKNESEEEHILNAEKGSKLLITGVISDMRLRHIVLNPATLSPIE